MARPDRAPVLRDEPSHRPLEDMVRAPRRLTDADIAEIRRHAASTGRGITASELLALVRDMTGATASAPQGDLGAQPAEP